MRSSTATGLLVMSLWIAPTALAQRAFDYKNEFSTTQEATRAFGVPLPHSKNDPSLNAGSFKFELGSKLECGNIDINANINGQFEELQRQLKALVPRDAAAARKFLTASAFTTICYAYPTICAQLRHDWLSIQGKLNLRAQACAAVDKFIDNQADKGARQLQSEAQAACVRKKAGSGGDVAAALKECQGTTGLAMRDFQTGVMRKMNGEKQRVLLSMLSFAKDDTAYDFLTTFLGEILINTDGGWEPLFEKGLLRPADVADAFLTRGQSLVCGRVREIHAGRFVTSNVYETEVAALVKRKVPLSAVEDLDVLSGPDRRLACLALGRAVGREAALKASARYESLVSTGLLNTAIPEALRSEYRDRTLAAFPALRAALESEDIPSVESVRADLTAFAAASRARSALLASEANRGRLQNTINDAQAESNCTDSLTCQ
ncbi:MAG: hypothetical protein IOD12_16385 [Silvanigrellales bacterium]|nr:hypothetical protein [Silvanigrellales bacterium]